MFVDNTLSGRIGAWFWARFDSVQGTDLFIDARSQNGMTYYIHCNPYFDTGTGNGSEYCTSGNTSTFNRLTSWTRPSAGRIVAVNGNPDNRASLNGLINPSAFTIPIIPVTNIHENDTLSNLPNFYTGVGPGGIQGARNCYQYRGGVLQDGTGGTTATPLWPWPMDDRIKLALARTRALGLGGSPLAGGAGPGYAANTVTSEIASRYGAIPSQCSQAASGGTTPNPPTGLNLTQLWRTLWTHMGIPG
jgi:hypothetical protein